MSNFLNSCKEWLANLTNDAIGNALINIGIHTQEVAMIAITLGVLLLICRRTKVLRYGLISYLLGLLVELIGITMIK
ncbi:hypothetical protein [Clostridium sp.]|uniref:hypothetical protein n=1 Tax=Clostridium sp. TaxID=1506 RepID=UPI002847DABE|nr:hypothetical protein [Clostridium sp.]MDR3593574.1 hypothetical protein [Clostridium sp.]